jgi:hypothetical protein
MNREVPERRAEVGGGHTVAMMTKTTQLRRSEGPPAGCAGIAETAAGLPFGAIHSLPSGNRSRDRKDRLGTWPTVVADRNARYRLPGGEPCEGEPHARFWEGVQETNGRAWWRGSLPVGNNGELRARSFRPVRTAPAPYSTGQGLVWNRRDPSAHACVRQKTGRISRW